MAHSAEQVEIGTFSPSQQEQVIELILHVQNVENSVDIPLLDQPDLLDIHGNYIASGGNFWVAVTQSGRVVGSIGLLVKGDTGVMKKFFVYKEFRGKEFGTGARLYKSLLDFAKQQALKTIVLDTPSSAKRSHSFYIREGFRIITKEQLPVQYDYPDRNSLIFALDL